MENELFKHHRTKRNQAVFSKIFFAIVTFIAFTKYYKYIDLPFTQPKIILTLVVLSTIAGILWSYLTTEAGISTFVIKAARVINGLLVFLLISNFLYNSYLFVTVMIEKVGPIEENAQIYILVGMRVIITLILIYLGTNIGKISEATIGMANNSENRKERPTSKLKGKGPAKKDYAKVNDVDLSSGTKLQQQIEEELTSLDMSCSMRVRTLSERIGFLPIDELVVKKAQHYLRYLDTKVSQADYNEFHEKYVEEVEGYYDDIMSAKAFGDDERMTESSSKMLSVLEELGA